MGSKPSQLERAVSLSVLRRTKAPPPAIEDPEDDPNEPEEFATPAASPPTPTPTAGWLAPAIPNGEFSEGLAVHCCASRRMKRMSSAEPSWIDVIQIGLPTPHAPKRRHVKVLHFKRRPDPLRFNVVVPGPGDAAAC
eukprot:EG_transcript_23324